MSTRPPRDSDPLAAAQAREHDEDDRRPAATAINLPPLRSRTVVLNNSLQAQWRGTAGRSHNPNSYVSDSQRHWVLLVLGLLAALLIVGTLHFSEPHGAHPQAVLSPDHPHMLKRAAAMAAQAAAASSGAAIVGPNPLASAFSVLYVTVPSAEVATKLASGLLEAKLVACANIIPSVTSMYRWEGKIQTDQEQLIMLKTRSSLFSAVSSFVVANHPYQTPEIIELPIQQGHKSYLEWIKASTKDPSEL